MSKLKIADKIIKELMELEEQKNNWCSLTSIDKIHFENTNSGIILYNPGLCYDIFLMARKHAIEKIDSRTKELKNVLCNLKCD